MRRGQAHLFIIIISALCIAGPLRAQNPPRTVRVSTIGHVGTPHSLTVSVDRAWRLIDLADRRLLCEGTGAAVWHFRISPGGQVLVQGEGDLRTATDSSVGAASASSSWTGGESGGFRLEGMAPDQRFTVASRRRPLVYPGAVEVWPAGQHSASGLRLINEAPLEQYLAGVVTAEGSAGFQIEALKALAVAARSYAERNRGRHQAEAEVCDTVHCQVYPGVGQVPEKVARAVEDTAGTVGLWNGAVIDGVFSADCGGRTRNSEDIWPGWGRIPYLRSVEDRPPNGGPDYCSVCRIHTLHLKLAPVQIGRLLGLRGAPARPFTLTQVERDGSGRIAALRLALSDTLSGSTDGSGLRGGSASGEGDEPLPCDLQQERGPTAPAHEPQALEMRSITLAQLRRSFGDQMRGRWVDTVLCPDGSLDLECRGLGHGVGLCQWGAQGMALPPYNRKFDEILRHYYTGISLGPVPVRTARLSLQLRGDGGQPLAGTSVRLLPGGPTGTTDGQGQWAITVPEGTYTVEARRETSAATFFAVRAMAGKTGETRMVLSWQERGDRVARARSNTAGERGQP